MSDADRTRLIDAYFDALDTDDVDVVRSALADGFVYESLSGTLEGAAGLERYVEELRGLTNTTHEVSRVLHAADASVAQGTVEGDGDDGRAAAAFCDVFEFDANDDHLTRISVYVNDS